jgi:isoleucyl-tRNA synthetase
MTAELQARVLALYDDYAFQPAMQEVQSFCSADLGGFYLDVIKDRLYTTKVDGLPRRSAQTALHHILQTLTTLIAPVLSFTAEEIWETVQADKTDSVFLHKHHALPSLLGTESLLNRWQRLRLLRAKVLKRIEDERTAGKVGSSLQADVVLHVSADDAALLASLGEELRFVMITSSARFEVSQAEIAEQIAVTPSQDKKCERCWHYVDDVGSHEAHPTICGRCVTNLDGAGETRFYA